MASTPQPPTFSTDEYPVLLERELPLTEGKRLDLRRGATLFRVEQLRATKLDVRHGWACCIALIYAGDDEPDPDKVTAADVMVVAVSPDTLTATGDGTVCVIVAAGYLDPVENLHPGDAEGLDWDMNTWHPTEADARQRAADVARHLTAHGIDVSTDDRP